MCCIIGLLLPLLTMYINILIIIQCLCGSLENRFHPKFKSLKNRLIIISVGLLSFFFIYLFLRFCLFFFFFFFLSARIFTCKIFGSNSIFLVKLDHSVDALHGRWQFQNSFQKVSIRLKNFRRSDYM